MSIRFARRSGLVVVLALFLAACESSEERAERHFQNGIELLEAGDVERAIVEFRSVFQLDNEHLEARRAMADAQLELGNLRAARRNLSFVVEQLPDDHDARITLAEFAVDEQNWEEVQIHHEVLTANSVDTPRAQAIGVILAYREAVVSDDEIARVSAETEATELLEALPESTMLRAIRVEALIREQKFTEALAEVDIAIEQRPRERAFHESKLGLLATLQDEDALEQHLKTMIELFPEDENLEATLLRFFLSQGDIDEAESYLRDRAAAAGDDITPSVDLIQFIVRTRGIEPALEELDARLAEEPGELSLRSLRASLLFDMGERDEAIGDLETALSNLSEDAETNAANTMRITLTRMFLGQNNEVAARRLIDEVLSIDPTNVEALKISASWLIEADQPEAAIQALRTALDQAPEDPEIMTLMAGAHERSGNRQLAGEMLALAVETSNNAPAESLRYALVLASQGNELAAEDILISSLRLNENNLELLGALGDLYISMEDWPRANQVVGTLRRIDSAQSISVANRLQVAVLASQDRTSETVQFLEQLASADSGSVGARIALARAHLSAGEVDAAIQSIESSLAENPESDILQFAAGAIYGAAGQLERAEEVYESIVSGNPSAERVWIELIRVETAQGKRDEAQATLDAALEALPEAPNLLWVSASLLEQSGDFEGAIAVYEQMYAADTNAPVIANNLASLISTYRTDEESLERAYIVARRLRGIEFAPFQDTYGWIAFRRGDLQDALVHLEPAAAGLPGDALVQYHLARTYEALDRPDEALEQYRKTLDVAGEADLRPQIADARQRIINLESGAATGEASE